MVTESPRPDGRDISRQEAPSPSSPEAPGRVVAVEPAPEKAEETHEYVTGLKLAAIMTSVSLAAFLLLLDISIISTAIPRITKDFDSLQDVGWYAGAYQLANACLQPLTGKVYAQFNAKWTFLLFFLVFEVGSLMCGVATSSSMLIGGRVVGGLGGSGMMNGGLTLIAGAVPSAKRPLYVGMLIGVAQLGLISGPLIGGALTEYTTWRWCFYLNLPLGAVVALFLIVNHVPEVVEKPKLSLSLLRELLPELDLWGFALFAPAAVMFLLAIQMGGSRYAWDSSVIIGLFCGAGATLVLFIYWESRMGDRAMIPGTILGRRIVWFSLIQTCFIFGTVSVGSFYLPIYFQGVKGVGPTLSGVYVLPTILGQLVAVVGAGALVSRLGYYLPLAVVSGVFNTIGNGLLSTLSPSTPTAKWAAYQVLLGLGRGAGMQIAIISIQNELTEDKLSVGTAMVIFAQNFAGAVLMVAGTTIFNEGLRTELATHVPSIPAEAVSQAGSSVAGLRALARPGTPEMDAVLLAFANSIDKVFYLMMACAAITFLAAWGVGWKDTRQKKVQEKAEV